ncbi:hypothetical protein [Citrobacter portucalensis]|uniref:hypothetical protein n=1 Tax=Citrobacter portucalensis TaxID=1639133 RepID=UPI00288A00BA|nr:hypothetical protein [Citrobacter portucalensis]WNI84421.1 hypothetical protein RIK60_13975 [Citrobacter portucalensis]
MKIPAFTAGDIRFPYVQLRDTFPTVWAEIPLPNTVASISERDSDYPRNAVNGHDIAIWLPHGMQSTALSLAGELSTRRSIHQYAANICQKGQADAGQVSYVVARSVSH